MLVLINDTLVNTPINSNEDNTHTDTHTPFPNACATPVCASNKYQQPDSNLSSLRVWTALSRALMKMMMVKMVFFLLMSQCTRASCFRQTAHTHTPGRARTHTRACLWRSCTSRNYLFISYFPLFQMSRVGGGRTHAQFDGWLWRGGSEAHFHSKTFTEFLNIQWNCIIIFFLTVEPKSLRSIIVLFF